MVGAIEELAGHYLIHGPGAGASCALSPMRQPSEGRDGDLREKKKIENDSRGFKGIQSPKSS